MKAKFYIGFIAAVLLPGFLTQAQTPYSDDYGYGNGGTVINNYYGYDYDYYYASRINRFHRAYSTFDYYSPVFTDVYWYNYQPFTWGLSIYNGFGSGLYFDWGWNNPWYAGYAWTGYDPFYYSSWYAPFTINIGFGSYWGHNYYNWNRHNRWDWDYRHDYRHDYGLHNNYYERGYQAGHYTSGSGNYNRNNNENNNIQNTNVSRRASSNYSQTDVTRNGRNGTSTTNNTGSRRAVNTTTVNGNSNISGDRNVTNNNYQRTSRSYSEPAERQVNRSTGQVTGRSQNSVSGRPAQSVRRESVNTNTGRSETRSVSGPASSGRSSVSSGSRSVPERSVSTPSRSSSSSAAPRSSSSGSSSVKSGSTSSGGSSSKENGRRR